MAELIQRDGLSDAWQAATEILIERGGKMVNLNVAYQASEEPDQAVTERLDAFVFGRNLRHGDGNLLTVNTVASTIFPASLYHPHLGDQAAPRLFENYELSMRLHQRRKRDKETYFNRLVAYPVDGSTWNQLEYYVDRLRRQSKKGHRSSSYELGTSHPSDAELRVQAPYKDKKLGSFPCLSHISLTLADGQVHMNATYRNQTFITRAYGNYVGLRNLLRFIATEAEVEPGEVQVVATHADAELELGKRAIEELVHA